MADNGTTKQQPVQVPADLLKLIYRLASLPRGHVYQLTVVVPEAATPAGTSA